MHLALNFLVASMLIPNRCTWGHARSQDRGIATKSHVLLQQHIFAPIFAFSHKLLLITVTHCVTYPDPNNLE